MRYLVGELGSVVWPVILHPPSGWLAMRQGVQFSLTGFGRSGRSCYTRQLSRCTALTCPTLPLVWFANGPCRFQHRALVGFNIDLNSCRRAAMRTRAGAASVAPSLLVSASPSAQGKMEYFDSCRLTATRSWAACSRSRRTTGVQRRSSRRVLLLLDCYDVVYSD